MPVDLGDLSNFAFFALINDFLRNEIDIFQWELLTRMTLLIGTIALTLLTIWVLFQGFRIVTGRSRDSAMGLVVDSLRAMLIVGLATSMAAGGSNLYWTLTDGLSMSITEIVTGDDDSPYENIDKNLAAMQISMMVIDKLETGQNEGVKEDKDRAMLFTGVGVAGPAVVAAAMLLLNKIAMGLFVGFGPLFILCLLFEQTKQLFSKWLFYGLGTMFSLAVLSVMVGVAMKMVAAVALAYAAQYVASNGVLDSEGMNSMALQQGGLGLVMTVLIMMAPPMAAMFFQGTLGNFSAYSQFGVSGKPMTDGSGRPGGHVPQPVQTTQTNTPYLDGGSRPMSNHLALSGVLPGSSASQQEEVKTGFGAPTRDRT